MTTGHYLAYGAYLAYLVYGASLPYTMPVPSQQLQPTQPVPTQQITSQVWWCAGPSPVPFTLASGVSGLASVKSGLITSAYCSLADMIQISVPEDSQHDYSSRSLDTWLRVGAARINEFLGQRFNVPLTVWSDTVVWANAELAYIGATRRRGINTEAMQADFKDREAAVMSWLKQARDHEITPDQRLSVQDQPVQALRYLAQPSQGWDRRGYDGLAVTLMSIGKSRW